MERDFGIEEVQVARVFFRLAGNVVFVASLVNLIGHLLQSKREEISQSVIAIPMTLCSSSTGACVKMMEVETASSITSVTISSIMEVKD